MRNDTTGVLVSFTTGHGLDDVQVVLDLVEAAVVRKSIEKRTNRVFRRHGDPIIWRMMPEYELVVRNSTRILNPAT